jgi:hypothetical protein
MGICQAATDRFRRHGNMEWMELKQEESLEKTCSAIFSALEKESEK